MESVWDDFCKHHQKGSLRQPLFWAKLEFVCWAVIYVLPQTTVFISHTSRADFSMVDFSMVGIVAVPKRSAMETSRRGLSENVSFGIFLRRLGCRAVELGKTDPRGGGDTLTPSYAIL